MRSPPSAQTCARRRDLPRGEIQVRVGPYAPDEVRRSLADDLVGDACTGDLLALAFEGGLRRSGSFQRDVSECRLPARRSAAMATARPDQRDERTPNRTSPVGAAQLGSSTQTRASGAPHSWQNFGRGGFSCWHRGHCMPAPSQRVGAGTGRTGAESLVWRRRTGQGRAGADAVAT